jgi:tetratricopeptide (TPR) repeat protein
MCRRNLLAIAILFVLAPAASAETAAGSVREGNALYLEGNYDEALKKYQAAQVESPADSRIMFNLGDAQYKLESHEEALSEYLRAASAGNEKTSGQSQRTIRRMKTRSTILSSSGVKFASGRNNRSNVKIRKTSETRRNRRNSRKNNLPVMSGRLRTITRSLKKGMDSNRRRISARVRTHPNRKTDRSPDPFRTKTSTINPTIQNAILRRSRA